MEKIIAIVLLLLPYAASASEAPVLIAKEKYWGLNENEHTAELKDLMGINPKETPWCAAFVNSILKESGYTGTNSNLARSFLKYGEKVSEPKIGDIVVFPREISWQGHVGFYYGNKEINGELYYLILGGNQNNEVNITPYKASTALGIRRY